MEDFQIYILQVNAGLVVFYPVSYTHLTLPTTREV